MSKIKYLNKNYTLGTLRETLKRNSEVAEKLKTKNSELAAETENEKIRYNEVSENIASEDSEAIRNERRSIRSGIAAKAARWLQAAYGRRYSGEILREVENEVDAELGDAIGKQSLLEQLRQTREVSEEREVVRREEER